MNNKNVVLVCAHKMFNFDLPSIYYPIVGGAFYNKIKCDWYKDNDGKDNISSKNPCYCELTALYWGWKHLNYNNLGLVHYRRYFKGNNKAIVNGKKIKVISNDEINQYLSKYDLIVPKKRHYVIETLYSHYCRTLREEPMEVLENVIKELYPEYIDEFKYLKIRRSAHMFNMLVARKEFLDKYLMFLFDVLKNIEDRIDSSTWIPYEKRYNGTLAELLLDVYLRKNKIKYKEIKVKELISFAMIKKGLKYFKTKIFGKKYLKSDN